MAPGRCEFDDSAAPPPPPLPLFHSSSSSSAPENIRYPLRKSTFAPFARLAAPREISSPILTAAEIRSSSLPSLPRDRERRVFLPPCAPMRRNTQNIMTAPRKAPRFFADFCLPKRVDRTPLSSAFSDHRGHYVNTNTLRSHDRAESRTPRYKIYTHFLAHSRHKSRRVAVSLSLPLFPLLIATDNSH